MNIDDEIEPLDPAERAPQSDFPHWLLEMIEPGEDDVAAFLDWRHGCGS